MFSKILLVIYCFFFSGSAKCQDSNLTTNRPPYPTQTVIATPSPEIFRSLTSLNVKKGTNKFRILVNAPQPSDGFQIHIRFPQNTSDISLVQTNVPEINTLTSRVDGQNLWLAGITKNPTQPWTSKNLVEVGQFTFNSPNNQSLTLDLGSASNILQHITGTNLLDKKTASITIEEVNP
jgi:hypothetical protein